MPRTMRVEYPGAIYHVMDPGDRQEDIHLDDADDLNPIRAGPALVAGLFGQALSVLLNGRRGDNSFPAARAGDECPRGEHAGDPHDGRG